MTIPQLTLVAAVAAAFTGGCAPDGSPDAQPQEGVPSASALDTLHMLLEGNGVEDIPGVDSVQWAATREEVVDRMGPPDRVFGSFGETVLFYRADSLLGYPLEKRFYLDQDGRFYLGTFDLTVGDRCHEAYDGVKEALVQRYPMLTPEPHEPWVPERGYRFCNAANVMASHYSTRWEDTDSGSSIELYIAGTVTVAYRSPRYEEAEREFEQAAQSTLDALKQEARDRAAGRL